MIYIISLRSYNQSMTLHSRMAHRILVGSVSMQMVQFQEIVQLDVEECKVIKINHETNKCADYLAKFSLSINGGRIYYTDCPEQLYGLMLEDCRNPDVFCVV
ncbi:hypothetical protein RYX36_006770 [Vicia faba]